MGGKAFNSNWKGQNNCNRNLLSNWTVERQSPVKNSCKAIHHTLWPFSNTFWWSPPGAASRNACWNPHRPWLDQGMFGTSHDLRYDPRRKHPFRHVYSQLHHQWDRGTIAHFAQQCSVLNPQNEHLLHVYNLICFSVSCNIPFATVFIQFNSILILSWNHFYS